MDDNDELIDACVQRKPTDVVQLVTAKLTQLVKDRIVARREELADTVIEPEAQSSEE